MPRLAAGAVDVCVGRPICVTDFTFPPTPHFLAINSGVSVDTETPVLPKTTEHVLLSRISVAHCTPLFCLWLYAVCSILSNQIWWRCGEFFSFKICYIKCLLRKAKPEEDFRYFSKRIAVILLEKPEYHFKTNGTFEEEYFDLMLLCSRTLRFRSDVEPI